MALTPPPRLDEVADGDALRIERLRDDRTAVDRAARLELRDAGPEALLGPLRLPGRRSRRLLDAVDATVLLAGHQTLGRPGAVALDPDGGERVVPVAEGELAPVGLGTHSPRRCVPPGRNGSSTEALQAVSLPARTEQRDGMADVADPLER